MTSITSTDQNLYRDFGKLKKKKKKKSDLKIRMEQQRVKNSRENFVK